MDYKGYELGASIQIRYIPGSGEKAMNMILLRIEGLAALGLSLYFYSYLQFSWLMFVILLLTPDLSALGYLRNSKFGSILYNSFHTYSIPALILIGALWMHHNISFMISLIWVAHIGMDRMFGFGLKYPSDFHYTHLDRN